MRTSEKITAELKVVDQIEITNDKPKGLGNFFGDNILVAPQISRDGDQFKVELVGILFGFGAEHNEHVTVCSDEVFRINQQLFVIQSKNDKYYLVRLDVIPQTVFI